MKLSQLTTESISLWIYNHFKKILFILICPLVGLLVWLAQTEWDKRQEATTHQNLYVFYKKLKKMEEASNSPGYRDQTDNIYALLSKKSKKKTSFVYSEDMDRVAQEYKNQITTYRDKLAGATFAIDLANFYYTHNKKQEAIDLLSQFALPHKKQDIYHLVTAQLANYYINNNNCQKAIPLWKGLSENKKATYFHKEAYIQLGLCYENQKNYSQAEEVYQKIIQESSNEFETQKARDYMNLMKIQRKTN